MIGRVIDGIAGGLADPCPPVLGQKSLELADLLGKAVRGVARQRDVLPDQALRSGRRARRQPRRFGVIEIGDDEHGGGMFEQPVSHLLQHQPHVLVADLFGHDIERHGRKARMHRAHHPRQHGAVADAGIEDPQRRRRRLQIAELQRDAVADLGLLAAGRDEQQVFLPVVEEAKTRRRDVRRSGGAIDRPCRRQMSILRWRRGRAMLGEIGAHLVERAGRDPRAVAQPRHQLAVIDDEAAESGFRGLRGAAKFADLAEDLLGGGGDLSLTSLDLHGVPPWFSRTQSRNGPRGTSTTNGVGRIYGRVPIDHDSVFKRSGCGSREENASKQKDRARSDAIGTERL